MMSERPSAAKATTKHAAIESLIVELRTLHARFAKKLAVIGDELADANVAIAVELADAKQEADDLRRDLFEAETAIANDGEIVEAWTELLEDFSRGIRDADELLEKTIGKAMDDRPRSAAPR